MARSLVARMCLACVVLALSLGSSEALSRKAFRGRASAKPHRRHPPPHPAPHPPRSADAAACVPHRPKTLDVGGPKGWVVVNLTQSWKHPSIYVGDTIRFDWSESNGQDHNLFIFRDASSYSTCFFDSATEVHGDRPIKMTLSAPGTYYYGCEEKGHCRGGQKVAVEVLPAPSQDCPSPPQPPTSPAPPSPPPPPPSPPLSGPQIITVGDTTTQLWNFGMTPSDPSMPLPWVPPPVHTGDTLEFIWDNGAPHNVYLMKSKAAFDKCTVTSQTSTLLNGGPGGTGIGDYKYKVAAAAGTTLYFACNVDNFHCAAGMKIAIPVS